MDIIIHKALPEDAQNYADCHISCWQTAYKGIVPDEYLEKMLVDRQKMVDRYKERLTNPGTCEHYCVLYEEKMIGFITIDKSIKNDDLNNTGIWAVYLIEEFRNRGFGKKMLDFSIKELKSVAPKEISLWVFEENVKARRFYEKNNFIYSNIKREVDWYGKPLSQLKYVLKI